MFFSLLLHIIERFKANDCIEATQAFTFVVEDSFTAISAECVLKLRLLAPDSFTKIEHLFSRCECK